jgi:hypothetical protein
MTRRFDFGWRVPDFGEEHSGERSARALWFRDLIKIHSLIDNPTFRQRSHEVWSKEVIPKLKSFLP